LDLGEAEGEIQRETETQREAHTEGANADTRGQIAGFEKKANRDSDAIAMRPDNITHPSTDCGRFLEEVLAIVKKFRVRKFEMRNEKCKMDRSRRTREFDTKC
jgi:hypothetical protein